MNNNESISLTVASLITFFIFGVLLIAFYVSDNNVLLTFSGSVVGAFLSGCISFAVMYFTNKAGKENVEQTLRQNEIQYLTNQKRAATGSSLKKGGTCLGSPTKTSTLLL